MGLYHIVSAKDVRKDMLPNEAMGQLARFFNAKIKLAAAEGKGSVAIRDAVDAEGMFDACPSLKDLAWEARAVALETFRDAMNDAGYKCQLFKGSNLITIHWVGG